MEPFGGGVLLKASAPDQMLPVRAVEGAGRLHFCRGIQRWMDVSAQLLSSPPPVAAAAAAGFFSSSCDKSERDFTYFLCQHVSSSAATDAGRRDLRRKSGGTNR